LVSPAATIAADGKSVIKASFRNFRFAIIYCLRGNQ
jgi:hypothetical protein